MPVIHASLSDDDFVDFSIMARKNGMTRTQFASIVLSNEVKKEAPMVATRAEAIKFNAQGLPLAQRLKTSVATGTIAEGQPGIYTDADGTPLVPMYERD